MSNHLQRDLSLLAQQLLQTSRVAARDVCTIDDEVDECNRQMIQHLKETMAQSTSLMEPVLHLFSATLLIERIADHATNIAEDVVYLVEGEILRHRTL